MCGQWSCGYGGLLSITITTSKALSVWAGNWPQGYAHHKTTPCMLSNLLLELFDSSVHMYGMVVQVEGSFLVVYMCVLASGI